MYSHMRPGADNKYCRRSEMTLSIFFPLSPQASARLSSRKTFTTYKTNLVKNCSKSWFLIDFDGFVLPPWTTPWTPFGVQQMLMPESHTAADKHHCHMLDPAIPNLIRRTLFWGATEFFPSNSDVFGEHVQRLACES